MRFRTPTLALVACGGLLAMGAAAVAPAAVAPAAAGRGRPRHVNIIRKARPRAPLPELPPALNGSVL